MILNHQRSVGVHLGPLRAFFDRIRKTLRLPREAVTVCLVGEAAITRLNRTYRAQRGATDVLSFPADGSRTQPRKRGTASRGFSASYLGDIAIAPAVARRNARRFGRSLEDELRILILHGVLHLLGYDHETDRGEMDRRERRLRARLGLR